MPDRDKVIKWIGICLQRFHCGEDCPYYNDAKIGCEEQLRDDVLTLLKEQEAVAVHDPGAYCPKCGWMLYPEDHPHHCGNCGHEVKWE